MLYLAENLKKYRIMKDLTQEDILNISFWGKTNIITNNQLQT